MKLINIIAAFISILFINQCLYAQEPDPNSFFPMDEGNFWQYAFLNDIVREEYVSKDSLLPDGSRLIYVVIDNIVYNEPGYFIDTNYNVFLWHRIPDQREFIYKLDAVLGEEWWVWHNTTDTTQGDFKRIESIYTGTYFGEERIFKEIYKYSREIIHSEYIDILDSREIIASGLGIVLKATDNWVEPPVYLVSAIINSDTLGIIVGIEDPLLEEPNHNFHLSQNYPNPFNPTTTISYNLSAKSYVSVKVFDILGNEVTILDDGERAGGKHTIKWDGKDTFQRQVNSGIYFIHLATPEYNKTIKAVFLK